MSNPSDQTFITNEEGRTLRERFQTLIQDTKAFDVLVGYFYTSGFSAIYKSLESAEKIRILIGIATGKETADMLARARRQQELPLSHAETQEKFAEKVEAEMSAADDKREVEDGVAKFIEWLQSGKLEIKAYPSRRLHAKLYIMSFAPGDRDAGRVITGSSNFTEAGLAENLEFNVELKGRADYEFAKRKFEDLWADAVDVKERYIETIKKKTWLSDNITPYELYLKFLYEYFRDELGHAAVPDPQFGQDEDVKILEYQVEAVHNAKRIIDEYGGVFLSDVVGLGKTYMAAMLAHMLGGKTLILAPPALVDKNNPGSWPNVFYKFNLPNECESFGKLDRIIKNGFDHYDNIFIDEAHRFRVESNMTYEKIAQICREKSVVLVTATPFNNSPRDLLSQIKFFQPGKKSSIPNLSDLEAFFGGLERNLEKLRAAKDRKKYMDAVAKTGRKIREQVLQYLMVRRMRSEIETYYANDLRNENLKFPKVENPQPAYYQLDENENAIFDKTVELIARKLVYARYMPMAYYEGKDKPSELEKQSQVNMGRFMKILLIKRLESSFYAFRKTVGRFIEKHEQFLRAFNAGDVYVSKKYTGKIFDLLDSDNEEAVQKFLDSDGATKYPAAEFSKEFKQDLDSDLKTLREIQELWSSVTNDPKLREFKRMLGKNDTLKQNKLIVFTESKETADYLFAELSGEIPGDVLAFSGGATARARARVIENFDANVKKPKDDYRVLITTEVLSEGVNLHRSNVVINYDIPWNPTRLMQRVGRINRVDTKFDKIHTFNFFPTAQADKQIHLERTAVAKISMFITMLGADARLLTDGEEIESFALFKRITSAEGLLERDEDAERKTKYRKEIEGIRDSDPDLFERIKRLPKKARTARRRDRKNRLLTYFRKGKLQKFFVAGEGEAEEMGFTRAAALLKAEKNTPQTKLPDDFYGKLGKNKRAFEAIAEQDAAHASARGRSRAGELRRVLEAMMKDMRQYTDEQETYLKTVTERLESGALTKHTITEALAALEKQTGLSGARMLPLLAVLQQRIPNALLKKHRTEHTMREAGPGKIILSEYMVAG